MNTTERLLPSIVSVAQPLDGYSNPNPRDRVSYWLRPNYRSSTRCRDLISTAFSAYIIFLAARFRLPREVLLRMIFNIGLEAVVGSVPLVGDLFDAYYKSNIRNLALLEQHLQVVEPEITKIASLAS